jgi:hypothetical protein
VIYICVYPSGYADIVSARKPPRVRVETLKGTRERRERTYVINDPLRPWRGEWIDGPPKKIREKISLVSFEGGRCLGSLSEKQLAPYIRGCHLPLKPSRVYVCGKETAKAIKEALSGSV